MGSSFHQDWEPVVLSKKKKDSNPPPPAPAPKKEIETGDDLKKIPKMYARAIQTKRTELKITQEKLAKSINEKTAVVNDIENARGTYDHVVMNKILKALGLSRKIICCS
jgi:ribosome-binding protein aMBF1 (putative translation factor)